MAHIDIRINFSVEQGDSLDEKFYRAESIERLDSILPETEIIGIQETLAQSDFGQVEFLNGVIESLEGKRISF